MTDINATLVDPLDANVNDVDISYPRLPAALYDMQVRGAKLEPNKDKTGENLAIQLATTSPHVSVTGESIAPGLLITHYVGLTPRETPGKQPYTIESIKRSLAAVAQAAGLNCSCRELIQNPTMLCGKIVRVKVGLDKETAEFQERNSIKGFVVVA